MLTTLVAIVLGIWATTQLSVPKGPFGHMVATLAYSPSGETLAVSTYRWRAGVNRSGEPTLIDVQQFVDLIDLNRDKVQWMRSSTPKPFSWRPWALRNWTAGTDIAFSPDGKMLAVSAFDNPLEVWNPLERRRIATVSPWVDATSLAYADNGSTLLSANEAEVTIWDSVTHQKKQMIDPNSFGNPFGAQIAVSRDSRTVFTCLNGKVGVWDTLGNEVASPSKFCDEGDEAVAQMALSSDDHLLAVSYYGKRMEIRRIATGERLSCPNDPRRVRDLAFIPGTHTLAIADDEQGLILFEIASGNVLNISIEQTGRLSALACDPHSHTIATGNSSGRILLWDLNSLAKVDEYRVDLQREFPLLLPWWAVAFLLVPWLVIWVLLQRKQIPREQG